VVGGGNPVANMSIVRRQVNILPILLRAVVYSEKHPARRCRRSPGFRKNVIIEYVNIEGTAEFGSVPIEVGEEDVPAYPVRNRDGLHSMSGRQERR